MPEAFPKIVNVLHTFIGIPVTVVDLRLKCFWAIAPSLLTNWEALWEQMAADSDTEPWKSVDSSFCFSFKLDWTIEWLDCWTISRQQKWAHSIATQKGDNYPVSRVFFILTLISTSSPIFVQCMTIKGDFAQRISSNIIAVKCNLKELTTRSTCLVISLVSSIFYMSVQQDSMCSWTQVHCSIVVFRLLVCVFMSVSVSSGAWGLLS